MILDAYDGLPFRHHWLDADFVHADYNLDLAVPDSARGDRTSGYVDSLQQIASAAPLSPEDDIVVIGRRPPLPDLDGGGLGSGGSTGGGSTGGEGGGGGGGGTTTDTSQDCRDHRALDAETAIEAKSDDGTHEYGSIVYRGSDGQVHNSPPIRGTSTGITTSQIASWMNNNNVAMSQVVGFVHNHDAYEYGTSTYEANVNRYPSSNDWNFADWMVGQGAGGAGGSGFAMYVIDPDGQMREFNYSLESRYENLSADQRNSGMYLPDEMASDGSTC